MRGNGECTLVRLEDFWTLLTIVYRFKGPKITLNLDDLSESQERALKAEGLEVEGITSGRSQSVAEAQEKKDSIEA